MGEKVIFLWTNTESSARLSVMTLTSSTALREQIEQVQTELAALGPIHPGSLSEQYNVCGTPGCRCKDPENPQKHGPYYQLSFTWRGKSSSRFVKQDRLEATRRKVANYKQLRELVNRWVDLAVELERTEREEAKASHAD